MALIIAYNMKIKSLTVLVRLRDLVKEKAKSKVSIEKWSYDRLIEGLDKSIRRENGESRIE